MSKYMLCDQDTINDVNPFVSRDFSLPGGIRQLSSFADRSLVKEKSGMEVQGEKSPFCGYARTGGWRTKDMCEPSKPNCFDDRPLYPERNIDYGFVAHADPNHRHTIPAPRARFDFRHVLILIILIIAVLLILRR